MVNSERNYCLVKKSAKYNPALTNSGAAFVPSFQLYGNQGREQFVNVSNVSDGSVTVSVILFGKDGVDRTEDFVQSTQPLVVPPKGKGRIEIFKAPGFRYSEDMWGRVRWESESSRCLNKPLLATFEESRLENGGDNFIGTRAIRNGNRF